MDIWQVRPLSTDNLSKSREQKTLCRLFCRGILRIRLPALKSMTRSVLLSGAAGFGMTISLLAGVDENGVLGRDNK